MGSDSASVFDLVQCLEDVLAFDGIKARHVADGSTDYPHFLWRFSRMVRRMRALLSSDCLSNHNRTCVLFFNDDVVSRCRLLFILLVG